MDRHAARKLERLRAEGIDPFPHAYPGVAPIEAVHAAHADLEDGEETESRVPGGRPPDRPPRPRRRRLPRPGRPLGHASRSTRASDVLGEESFDTLTSLDLGDLIGVDGTAFRSRRGELTLRATDWTLLAKSLRPPPDKFHGLEDVETRYRHRELDLIANEEARELFILRSRVVRAIRRWLDERGFLEVETPVLQPLYGGALAAPFTTHHNALDRDLYLRIADELYLKRLIVGGLERVYELGKDFRNEGVSPQAQPRVHDARVVRGLRGLQGHRRAARGARLLRGRGGRLRRPSRLLHALAPRDACATRSTRRPASTCSAHRDRDELVAAAAERDIELDPGDTWAKLVDDLLSKHVEPKLEQPDVHPRLPDGAVAVRQGPPLRAGTGRALRVLRRRHGVRQRVHRAERPGRAARALRAAAAPTRPRATRRPSPTTRTTCARSSRACRRPAASASASTAW